MLTLTLSTLGLPLEGVALLLAIDPTLDMMRTATNVAGQALVPTLVVKREGILDVAAYHAARGRDVLGESAADTSATSDREEPRETRHRRSLDPGNDRDLTVLGAP